MSTPADQNSLSDLPGKIAQLTSAVPAAARAVTAASVDRWAPDNWPPMIATLQRAQFDWRIQFVKDETETILFFIKIPRGQFVMLDATASITILGTWDLEPTDPLTPENVHRLAQFPTFLNLNPSDDFANTYKPVGANASQTIFFALGFGGRNILAVANPEQGAKALLRYSFAGEPGIPPKKGFPLSAFVDLSWTMRDWLAVGAPMGTSIPVHAPDIDQTKPQQILSSFVEAYGRCVNALRSDMGAFAPLDQRFRVGAYSVSITIPLAEDGTIARDKDDQRSALGMRLTSVSGDPIVATATLATPDFIISGDLYGEIFNVLSEPEQAEMLGAQIGKSGPLVIGFCQSARPNAAIFKIGADDGTLKLLMVLSGVMQGYPEIMVVRADYDGIFEDFLFVEEYEGDISKIVVSYADVGQWFFPLIAGIRFWVNELLTW
jgi:hypothetical protein